VRLVDWRLVNILINLYMDNTILKYNSLDAESKKQVRDFIDQMVAKMKSLKKKQSPYKKRILTVSIWSEDDIKSITDVQAFNHFKTEEW
jgi:hypothetical protein